MNWLEISVEAGGDPDAMCDTLLSLGAESFVIEDEKDFRGFLENNTQYWDFVDDKLSDDYTGVSRVKCWAADDEDGRALLCRIEQAGLKPAVKQVCDADWENNWRQYYHPIEIGQRLVIVPEWQDYDGDRIPVRLDPGLLFGTGDHPTTSMCLAAAEQFAGENIRVLDIGCGSGILGIAAAVLGSPSVKAVDVDEKAPDIVTANAALNGVDDRFSVLVGDVIADSRLRTKLGSGYELIFANIVADVIIPLAPHIPAMLADNGVFITSGIIEGRQDDVQAALTAAGFEILRRDNSEEWYCFVCRKGETA